MVGLTLSEYRLLVERTVAAGPALIDRLLDVERPSDEGWAEYLSAILREVAAWSGPIHHQPQRGNDVEAWIKAFRDKWSAQPAGAYVGLDMLLDEYRLRADLGADLSEDVADGLE